MSESSDSTVPSGPCPPSSRAPSFTPLLSASAPAPPTTSGSGRAPAQAGLLLFLFFQTDAGFRHWWEADPASEAGWRQSAWLGAYRPYPSGWIYHLGLGWAYASPDGHGGLWFWTGSEGWIWSAPHSWPHIYSNRSADWLYFIKEREGKPALYDYSTQSIR